MDFKVKNTVYLAAAGSGKTTLLVNKACAVPSTEYVLMLTYTDSNEQEIRNKFYKENYGVIPKNVFIMSWFSFLLQHLIKPYQNYVTDDCFEIKGFSFINLVVRRAKVSTWVLKLPPSASSISSSLAIQQRSFEMTM